MVRTTARIVATTLALGAALAWAPTATAGSAEHVALYDVAVTIGTDSNAHVTETVTYDFADNQRHGITRRLQGRTLTGTPTASSPDGAPAAATVSGDTIRVGSEDKTVSGTHTYVLNYDVIAPVSEQAGTTASLFWDVIDGSWEVPVDSVTGTITVPAAVSIGSCLRTTDGPCESGAATADGNVIHVHEKNIATHQSMTVSATYSGYGVTFPTGIVQPYAGGGYSYTYTVPTTATNDYASTSSSSSSASYGWVVVLLVVVVIMGLFAQVFKGSSRRSGYYSDSGSYSSYPDSGSSYSDSGGSSSDSGSGSSSDSGSSSSSCGSGSW